MQLPAGSGCCNARVLNATSGLFLTNNYLKFEIAYAGNYNFPEMSVKILFAAGVCVLFTCSRDHGHVTNTADVNTSANADTVRVSMAEVVPVVKEAPPADSAITVAPERPARTEQVRILTAGTFHSDEVWEGADKENWYGLFPGEQGFSIRKTKIITTRVADGLFDDVEKGEKTGWEVETESSEWPVLLITGLDLAETQTTHADIPSTIYPGDTVNFTYEGIPYRIFATGEALTTDRGVTSVTNYHLYISRTLEEKTTVALLVIHHAFDDAMTSIIWAGDIDGDKKLDLIIELSNHYNVTAPTLFLSAPAKENEVVVPVAEHRSVGC